MIEMNRIGFDLDFKHLKDAEPKLDAKRMIEKLLDVAVAYNADLVVCRSKNGYHFKIYMHDKQTDKNGKIIFVPQDISRELDLQLRAAYDSDGRLFWAEERGKSYTNWIGYLDVLHGRNYRPKKDSKGGERARRDYAQAQSRA